METSFGLALRLQAVCASVAQAQNVSLLQAWFPAASNSGEWTLYASPLASVCADPSLTQFRIKSCHFPVAFRSSMTGRVWRTGAVQVVQNLRLVPPTMHPRIYLSDADLERIGEALYIPVYDQQRPGLGPITVLEALLPVHSAVLPADLLSFLCDSLTVLKLSVSNPLPQPIKRSALTGRRARAPVGDSSNELAEAAAASTSTPADQAGGHAHAAPAQSAAAAAAVAGAGAATAGVQPPGVAALADIAGTRGAAPTSDAQSSGSAATHHLSPAPQDPGPAAADGPKPASAPSAAAAASHSSTCSSGVLPPPALLACMMPGGAWPHAPLPGQAAAASGYGSIMSAAHAHAQPLAAAPLPWASLVAGGGAANLQMPSGGPSGGQAGGFSSSAASGGMAPQLHGPAAGEEDTTYERLPRKLRRLSPRGLVRTQSMFRVNEAAAAGGPAPGAGQCALGLLAGSPAANSMVAAEHVLAATGPGTAPQ